MGKNLNLFKTSILLIICFLCVIQIKAEEENIYLKIKAMADGTYKPEEEKIADKEREEKVSKEDKELYDKAPVAPLLNHRFICNPHSSTEKFYEDEMKNHNYQK